MCVAAWRNSILLSITITTPTNLTQFNNTNKNYEFFTILLETKAVYDRRVGNMLLSSIPVLCSVWGWKRHSGKKH